MKFSESALAFDCEGETLVGVVAHPESPSTAGVVIAVGGPQYRAGSHRQFTLLARHLAEAGYPSLRFDFRGMGDSGGSPMRFDTTAPDIAAALAALKRHVPTLERTVLWGLCDAASAALLYWHETHDPRISGLCLLNPWVRSEATLARTHVRHYYGRRLRTAEFWKKLLSGGIDVRSAFGEAIIKARQTFLSSDGPRETAALPFQQRMAMAWQAFPAPILVILSENDLTAREFRDTVDRDPGWKGALSRPGVEVVEVADADHTFSTRRWRQQVADACAAWLCEIAAVEGRR